mmetsp:Transcript_48951/g.98652  ORF Transcript_48951/g.98652 Transcript_48951/m.98652 type:complete len:409 (-) Transcript_48951:59-1285(-)
MVVRTAWEKFLHCGTLGWLDVCSALRALQATRLSWELRPACIHPPSSLWDTQWLGAFSFAVLVSQCEELLKCMAAVRADPRFTFHEQYLCLVEDFYEDGHRISESDSKVGRLHGWRPGMPWPRRGGSDAEAGKFEYNLLPGARDASVHPSVTLAARVAQGTHATPADGFIDALDTSMLIAVHERPPAMMLNGGASDLLGAWDSAVFTWFINSYFCYDEFWCAVIGYVDWAGDFVLASGASYGDTDNYRGRGYSDDDIDDDFPPLRNACSVYYLDEFASVRIRHWDDMAAVFGQCWNDAARDRRQQYSLQPPDCLGRDFDDASDKFYLSEQFRLTRRFQRIFLRMARAEAQKKDTPWSIDLDEYLEISNVTDDGYTPLPHTLRHAAAGQIYTFGELIGEAPPLYGSGQM